VTLFTEELPWLEGRDLDLVMGRAICGLAGLEEVTADCARRGCRSDRTD